MKNQRRLVDGEFAFNLKGLMRRFDSDPRLQTQVAVVEAFGKKGVSDFRQKFQQNDRYGTFLLMRLYVSDPLLTL